MENFGGLAHISIRNRLHDFMQQQVSTGTG
ncbi:phage polarity suppression protein [Citrobacter sp. wls716]